MVWWLFSVVEGCKGSARFRVSLGVPFRGAYDEE